MHPRYAKTIETVRARAERILADNPQCHDALMALRSPFDLFGADPPLDEIGKAMSAADFSLAQASGVLRWCQAHVGSARKGKDDETSQAGGVP